MVIYAGASQALTPGRAWSCFSNSLTRTICSSNLLQPDFGELFALPSEAAHCSSSWREASRSASSSIITGSTCGSSCTQCNSNQHRHKALQHQGTGGPFTTASLLQLQQWRGYAAKGKGKAALAAPPPTPKAPRAEDPYAPPEFRVKRVPQSVKGNALNRLTGPQRALLQQLNPSNAPLRSLRQLGWPLGSKQLLGLLHDQLGEAAGTNVQLLPFVLEGMFQSATTLANVVKDSLEEGKGMPQVEQLLLTTIANLPPSEVTFEGIKVQVKGRMSGKGGMTTKRVWQWGRTSTANLSDPVDYAHEAVITRAGYVGIKVWIRYKRSVMQAQAQHTVRAPITVPQLLAQASPMHLPSRSSSAWWNIPAPLQPLQHRTWECYKTYHDPLATRWASLQQQHQQQQPTSSTAQDGSPPTAAKH